MLIAVDNDNERVLADVARRGVAYRCPACRAPVVLKQGRRVLAHFAHKPQQPCAFHSEPETADHLAMKRDLYERFKREPWVKQCELERVIGVRRADVWLDTAVGPVAIEGQVSPLTVEELAAKLDEYTARGIATLYIVHRAVLASVVDGAEVRVPAWVLALHALYKGRVYVWDEGFIVPVHLTVVLREPTGYGTRERRLKTTRRVMLGEPIQWLELRCALIGCQYGPLAGEAFAVAMFGDRVFWQC